MVDNNAVALKLPMFWTQQPQVWFLQTEAQFNIRKIGDDTTKYYYVVSSLDQSTAGWITDFLAHSPSDNKYEALKERLLETFGLSKRDRAQRLLHLQPLRDQKPLQLMEEMLTLLGEHSCCFLAEQLLEQLPLDLQLQLANDDFSNPRAKADVLWNAKCQSMSASVNRVTTQQQQKKQDKPKESRSLMISATITRNLIILHEIAKHHASIHLHLHFR